MYIGSEIITRLIRPKNGVRVFRGILQSYENGEATMDVGGEILVFSQDEISKVNLDEDV